MPTPYLPPSRVYQNHHLDSTRWKPYVARDDDIIISTALWLELGQGAD